MDKIGVALMVGGSIIVPFVAVPAVLGAVGFTGAGVAAGSAAAGIQSAMYGAAVPAGSVFAIAQSIGAAGLGSVGAAVSGTVGAAAGAVIRNLWG